jgi:hypothetical protein
MPADICIITAGGMKPMEGMYQTYVPWGGSACWAGNDDCMVKKS